ncbi:hypothetical protein AB832_01060, partial [Flavobacteriaceae bacterium (ex Bugula neritina AB1)]
FVIDTRSRRSALKQLAIKLFIFKKASLIFMVHSYNLKFYLSKKKWVGRYLYGSAKELIGVSEAIVDRFKREYKIKKGVCIYNAFDESRILKLSEEKVLLPEGTYILSYGRIVDTVKDYTFLVNAYAQSILPGKNIKLYILGDGPDKNKIQNLVKELALEDLVIFNGFTSNPFPYVKKACFTTLTSNYEGFSMVLIESLALGVPVVSVDCKSGPSEVVVSGRNGILVPWKKKEDFILAMNKMVTNNSFYKGCRNGATSSVSKFKMDNIGRQWQTILLQKK